MGELGESEAVDGVVNSRVRGDECMAGLECALVIAGALSAAPLDRDRRWLLEYGERLRGVVVGRGVLK